MRGPFALAVPLVAPLVAGAAACSFTSPFDDPTEYLGPAPAVDAAAAASADASFDASIDEELDATSDVHDATNDADWTGDALSYGGLDAARPCDATFCDDFDMPPLGAKWTAVRMSASSGTLSLVDAGRSPPFALRAETPAGAFTFRSIDVAKQFGAVTGASCSFAVNPIERPGRPAIFFFRGVTMSSDPWLAWVALTSTETTLGNAVFYSDGGPPLEAITAAPIAPLGQWTDLAITVEAKQVTLTVGGAPAAKLPVKFKISPTELSAHVGIQGFETTQQVVLFDDVVCNVTK